MINEKKKKKEKGGKKRDGYREKEMKSKRDRRKI